MKKLVSFAMMCVLALSMQAQRCAVMNFNAGKGVSELDLNGLSAIFTTYFAPDGYTLVDRSAIDRTLEDGGYERTQLKKDEVLAIGERLSAAKIVTGEVKCAKAIYEVEARILDVKTGSIILEEKEVCNAANARAAMKRLAQRIAQSIALPVGYVDLGLPSGTLWKEQNEDNQFYSYDAIVAKYGNALPTKEQFDELRTLCEWSWIGFGYKVVGPNGSVLIMPSSGYQHCDGTVHYEGAYGNYWSQTLNREGEAWFLYLDLDEARVYSGENCNGRSARLVMKP